MGFEVKDYVITWRKYGCIPDRGRDLNFVIALKSALEAHSAL
jgi:hypothetical protein